MILTTSPSNIPGSFLRNVLKKYNLQSTVLRAQMLEIIYKAQDEFSSDNVYQTFRQTGLLTSKSSVKSILQLYTTRGLLVKTEYRSTARGRPLVRYKLSACHGNII